MQFFQVKIDQNLLSFEKFLKNDDFQRTNFTPHFRPTFTHKNHILLIQIPYLHDRTSQSSIKFHQFFKVSRKFKISSHKYNFDKLLSLLVASITKLFLKKM